MGNVGRALWQREQRRSQSSCGFTDCVTFFSRARAQIHAARILRESLHSPAFSVKLVARSEYEYKRACIMETRGPDLTKGSQLRKHHTCKPSRPTVPHGPALELPQAKKVLSTPHPREQPTPESLRPRQLLLPGILTSSDPILDAPGLVSQWGACLVVLGGPLAG